MFGNLYRRGSIINQCFFSLFYVGIRPLHLPFFDLGAFLPDITYRLDGTRSLDISIRSVGLSLKGELESRQEVPRPRMFAVGMIKLIDRSQK